MSEISPPGQHAASSSRGRRKRVLIAGLGNLLLRDDGVGVHVIEALRRQPLPRAVVAVEVGTAPLDALHLLEWADEVHAVDAVAAGGPPGTLYRLDLDEVAESRQVSLHDLGLRSVCRLLPAGRQPKVIVWGVEPDVIAFGLDLSPAVQKSVPELVALLRAQVSDNLKH